MAISFKKFFSGINIKPKTASSVAVAGDLDFDTTNNKLNLHNGTTSSPVVTESSTATLTNKTLTSPTLTTPVLGTPSSGTLTSCTGLSLTTGVTGILPVANGGTGVSATVGILYTGAPPTVVGGTIDGTRRTVKFGTVVKDTNTNYSTTTGEYTVPSTGMYNIAAQVDIIATFVAGNNIQCAIAINGTTKYFNIIYAGGAQGEALPCVAVDYIPLTAGDIVTIQVATSGTAPSFASDARSNFVSIIKMGS